jgi:hypothetical protein
VAEQPVALCDGQMHPRVPHHYLFLLGTRHRPHYIAVQVEPTASAPGDVQGKSPTTVIMLRDLGNLRAPSFFFALFAAILFGIFSYSLHYRDRRAAATQALVP